MPLHRVVCNLLMAVAALAWTLAARADDVPQGQNLGPTEFSGIPWAPSETRVVYGTDDRVDITQEPDPIRKHLARAVCGLVDSSQLAPNGNGWNLSLFAYTQGGFPPCPTEPFATQPVAAFCTGFLVASDLIVTAGHCVDNSTLGSTRFVFGFYSAASTYATSDVYSGIQIVGSVLTGTDDWAIVRTDRAVTAAGAVPLNIRRSGTVAATTPLGVIGHPSGLPLKLAYGPTTAVADSTPLNFFRANLDTYGGNSGSPVFNATTHLVEGILVRGETDFVLQGSCFVSNVLPDILGSEESTKIANPAPLIPVLAAPTVVHWGLAPSPRGGNGSLSQPYNAVQVALFRLQDSGTLKVVNNGATSSSFTGTLSKPMQMESVGGPVQIGLQTARSTSGATSATGFVSR